MKVLVYAFKPWGKRPSNISQEVLANIKKRRNLIRVVFPVRFDREMFLKKVKAIAPDLIIGLGQYPRGNKIRIERQALNLWKLHKQDKPQTILRAGPSKIKVSLKLKKDSSSWVSYNGGQYVCNFSMYVILDFLKNNKDVKFGFIHIPKDHDVAQATKFVDKKLQEINSP
ncbi:hypothetical protein HYW35_01795 [Candidatus Saccharibacteria bacterium]|nr:hypothetical protein [Candidatus Saccharibacteria bacterium]